jgi:hypothetical protein
MNLVLTSNLKGYFDQEEPLAGYVDVPVTNPAWLPLERGIYGMISLTMKKAHIPFSFYTIDQWPTIEDNGILLRWQNTDTLENYASSLSPKNYTAQELCDYLEIHTNVADPAAGWHWEYNPLTRRISFYTDTFGENRTIFFSRSPIFAGVIGVPIQDLTYTGGSLQVAPFFFSPRAGISEVYVRIGNIETEDFQNVNIQDNDNIFACIGINNEQIEWIEYIPPVEHTIYFSQPRTLNEIEVSFMANINGSLHPIPFHGKHWVLDILYNTVQSKGKLSYLSNLM